MDLARSSRGGDKGTSKLPSKTTMNLYVEEARGINLRKAVIMLVLGLLLVGVFVKFGVIDPLSTLAAKQQQLTEQQNLLTKAAGSISDYAEIKELYEAYVVEYGTGVPDAIEVLDMVEQRVMGQATVTGITLSGQTLTLTIEGVSLETVGSLASNLEKEPMVQGTNVTSASTQDNVETTVSTLVVTLADAQGKEG